MVNYFKALGVVWELSSDIFGELEDWLQVAPCSLNGQPCLYDGVECGKFSLPVSNFLREELDCLVTSHGGNDHLVLFKLSTEFFWNDNVEHITLDEHLLDLIGIESRLCWVSSRNEDEAEVLPNVLQVLKLNFLNELLSGAVDDFGHVLLIEVQVEVEEVCELEVLVNDEFDLSLLHEFLPVALAHGFVSQVGDEWDGVQEILEDLVELLVNRVGTRDLIHLH